ncbi:MAG TPA: hypothetical protein VK002_05630 [Rubricoccaceae bacterium]|nr:hypothetical protein [Rubricoccaceae bacterium]
MDPTLVAQELGFALLVLAVVLFWYCTGGAWMLLVAGYPVHRLVGADEFAPFHRAFGRRLVAAFVVPGFVAYALSFVLVYLRFVWDEPFGASRLLALAVAGCSAVNLAVSLLYVRPQRRALAREGKSEAGIRAIERAHLVRTLAWTAGSVMLLYMTVQAIGLT